MNCAKFQFRNKAATFLVKFSHDITKPCLKAGDTQIAIAIFKSGEGPHC